jgi:hypothetical protein
MIRLRAARIFTGKFHRQRLRRLRRPTGSDAALALPENARPTPQLRGEALQVK